MTGDNSGLTSQAFDTVRSFLQGLGSQFTRELTYGKEGARELALKEEAIRLSQIGQGPNDPRLAAQAPNGILDLLFGDPQSKRPGALMPILVVVGVIVVIVLLLRK